MNNLGTGREMWREAAEAGLAASVLGQGMTPEERNAFLSASGVGYVRWGAGEAVFSEGDRPQGTFLLIRGAVGIRQDMISGREIFVTDIDEVGEVFGEVYFLLGKAYDISARALTASEGLRLSPPLFEGPLGAALTRRLLKVLAGKAYQMNRRLRVLGSGSLRGKIAQYLLLPGTKPPLSREALAARLAVTRPSLSREIGAMQREGLIRIAGRELAVVNRAALEEFL